MARYLILIYGDEQAWDAVSPQELEERHAAHVAFAATAGPAILGGAQLQPAGTATSLRAGADGRPTPTDGPFLETKEVLGGYYVVEASDLDAAIAMASRLREVTAGHGGVEIRPLVEPN